MGDDNIISHKEKKQHVFTVTESQSIYAVQNICLLMESGLTHNISRFSSLFSLHPLAAVTSCVFSSVCRVCVCKGCAFVPDTAFVWFCPVSTPISSVPVFTTLRLTLFTPQLVMCHLQTFTCSLRGFTSYSPSLPSMLVRFSLQQVLL